METVSFGIEANEGADLHEYMILIGSNEELDKEYVNNAQPLLINPEEESHCIIQDIENPYSKVESWINHDTCKPQVQETITVNPKLENVKIKHSKQKIKCVPKIEKAFSDKEGPISSLTSKIKKKKLYEIDEVLSDESMERRRIGAKNAKRNREEKKEALDYYKNELEKEKNLNKDLHYQLKSEKDAVKIATLEKEKSELKYQILVDKYKKLFKRCKFDAANKFGNL